MKCPIMSVFICRYLLLIMVSCSLNLCSRTSLKMLRKCYQDSSRQLHSISKVLNMIIILDITLLMMISLLPPWCWSHTFMILDITMMMMISSVSWYSTWFWWWWYQNHHTWYDFTDANLITGFDYNNVRSMKISLLSPC